MDISLPRRLREYKRLKNSKKSCLTLGENKHGRGGIESKEEGGRFMEGGRLLRNLIKLEARPQKKTSVRDLIRGKKQEKLPGNH